MAKADAAGATPEASRPHLARAPVAGATAPHVGSGLGLLVRQLMQEEGRWRVRRDGGVAEPVAPELLTWLERLQQAVDSLPGATAAASAANAARATTWSIELLRDGTPQHLIAATPAGITWTPVAGGQRDWALPATTLAAPPRRNLPTR
jgi:hypothetical protein